MKVIKHWYGLEEDNMYLFFLVCCLPAPTRKAKKQNFQSLFIQL